MFTIKLTNRKLGHVSFTGTKCLINKQYKYRSLGEMVALARATGERLLPTRNGVYTGEVVIPKETTDKINLQRVLMDEYKEVEHTLDKAKSQQYELQRQADKQAIIDEYKRNNPPAQNS